MCPEMSFCDKLCVAFVSCPAKVFGVGRPPEQMSRCGGELIVDAHHSRERRCVLSEMGHDLVHELSGR